MKIISYTGTKNSASSRFRIRQYINPLKEDGIDISDVQSELGDLLYRVFLRLKRNTINLQINSPINELIIKKYEEFHTTNSIDILWLQKELFPFCLVKSKAKKIFDIDDAIWFHTPQIKNIVTQVDSITAGNLFLAEWVERYNKNVYIIPTVIDTSRYIPINNNNEETFIIGWTGLSGNFKYFNLIERALSNLMNKYQDIELLIIADKKPNLNLIPDEKVKFIRWSPTIEVEGLRNISVGIMPLADTDWERGKCSFKMLQYMALEKPVVVSPVGMNVEVLKHANVGFSAINEEEWFEKIEYLYLNRNTGIKMGKTARNVVRENYSIESNIKKLINVFNNVL